MPVGKSRKTNKHLPKRMYHKHGQHWFVDTKSKWHNLGPDYAAALRTYANFQESGSLTHMAGLIARYENEVLPERAEETAKGRRKEFKRVRAVFGAMAPTEIKASHAWEYFKQRGKNQAALHEVRALSAVLSWGVKWGALDANPLLGVKFGEGKKFKPRDRYVTDDEFMKVRECAPPMIRYAMNIALITAARQKDIRLLKRSQVAAGFLQVQQSKTGKKVNFPAAGSLEENIDAALRESPQVRQYVIVNRTGKPYTMQGFQSQWKRAMAKAFPNVKDRFTFHDIRAKSISDTKSLEDARIRAGHSDARITDRVYRRLPETATVMDIGHLKTKK